MGQAGYPPGPPAKATPQKKWFQVTRFPAWLTTGMHGIEHREQERRTIRLSAPRWPFSPAPGSMLPGSPRAASCPEPVARNGFSLARYGCRLSATSIPGSKLPACYFASSQVGRLCPFGPSAPLPRPGLRRLRRFHCLWPVALPPLGSACRCQRSPLPSGIFASLGIKVFNRLCCLPVHLTNPPDFLSLPAARTGESWGCGSPFQVRYVSVGLLFLKPLGTFFTMIPMCVSVNAFLIEMAPIPQALFALLRISYSIAAVYILWIIRASRKMFYFSLRIMPLSVASHKFCSSAPDRIARRATAR